MTVNALPLYVSAEARIACRRPIEMRASKADVLARAIGSVNKVLLDKTRGQPEVKGLGATVVAVLYMGDGVLSLAHLGDSRAYLMRHGI